MDTWKEQFDRLKGLLPHQEIRISKSSVRHPSHVAGFETSWGFPIGQVADWRIVVDERSVHIREYRDSFGMHYDRVHPKGVLGRFKHLVMDLPIIAVPAVVLTATGIYYLVRKARDRS